MPVRAHHLADPEKGSGIAMICTFGDITDVTWWRELALPVRAVIQPDGTLSRSVVWGDGSGHRSSRALRTKPIMPTGRSFSVEGARGHRRAARRVGRAASASRARSRIAVKFYEKGDRPLEIVTSRQWFIKTMDFRDALLERGRELQWHPPYMQARARELGERL